MIGLLLRFAALGTVWGLSKLRRASAPAVVHEVERLSWTTKARLVWALSRDERVPLWTRVIILIPAFYLASPIDLLPDFIPLAGRLDDAAIFNLSMDLLARSTPQAVVYEHVERLRRK